MVVIDKDHVGHDFSGFIDAHFEVHVYSIRNTKYQLFHVIYVVNVHGGREIKQRHLCAVASYNNESVVMEKIDLGYICAIDAKVIVDE